MTFKEYLVARTLFLVALGVWAAFLVTILSGCFVVAPFGASGWNPTITHIVSCDPSPKSWYAEGLEEARHQKERLEALGGNRKCIIIDTATGEVVEADDD
jgi:hypothetical protein